VAQWRPGTGVIARFLDNTNAGTVYTPGVADVATLTTIAGSSLTLLANDCVIVEIWLHYVASGTPPVDLQLLLNGLGQYYAGIYNNSILTDTDAVLVAPAPITLT